MAPRGPLHCRGPRASGLKIVILRALLAAALVFTTDACSTAADARSTVAAERDDAQRCASNPPIAEIEDGIAAAIPRARDTLARELTDYPATRFRSVFAIGSSHSHEMISFCGLMIGGATSGAANSGVPFMIFTSPQRSFLAMADDAYDQTVEVMCGSNSRDANSRCLLLVT